MVDGEKEASPQEDKDIQEGKIWAVLGYLGILCLLPLLLKKDNKFALYHGKQGLILFLGEFAALIVTRLTIVGQVIALFGFVVFGVCSLIGMIKSLQGEYWKAPIISDLAEKINI